MLVTVVVLVEVVVLGEKSSKSQGSCYSLKSLKSPGI